MKKFSFAVVIVVTCVFVLSGYSSRASAQAKQKNAPVVVKYARPSTDAPPPANAVRGGIMKVLRPTFPKNLGYTPEWAPADSIFALPVAERLIDWDAKGTVIPWLA